MSIFDPNQFLFEFSLTQIENTPWVDFHIECSGQDGKRVSQRTKIKNEHLDPIRLTLIEAFATYQQDILGPPRQRDKALPDLTIATSGAFVTLLKRLDEIAIAQEKEPPRTDRCDKVGSFLNSIIATYGKYRGTRIEVQSNITFFPFDLLYCPAAGQEDNLKGFLGRIFQFVYWSSKPKMTGSHDLTIRRGGRLKYFQQAGLEGQQRGSISEMERQQLRNRCDELGLTFVDCEVDSNVGMKARWLEEADLTQICHFTCHHECQGLSRLQLSDTYVFHPNILQGFDPPHPKPLVFLNTCEGAGRGSNNVDSLINDFYPDHSKGLVTTFARVRLAYGIDFANTFYKNLSLPEQGALDALTNTKEELIAKNRGAAAVYLIYGLFCVQPNLMVDGEESLPSAPAPTLVG